MTTRKANERGKIHFHSDFKFDPRLEEKLEDAKEHVQCLKNRDIDDARILWMPLGYANKKLPIYGGRDDALCLRCTPEWIRSN